LVWGHEALFLREALGRRWTSLGTGGRKEKGCDFLILVWG